MTWQVVTGLGFEAGTRSRHMAARGVRLAMVVMALSGMAEAGVLTGTLASGPRAVLHNGRTLFMECEIPEGGSVRRLLSPFLQDESSWTKYEGRRAVAIPYTHLKPSVQRELLLAVFPKDRVDVRGWTHYVSGPEGQPSEEDLLSLCEWLTGNRANSATIITTNKLSTSRLRGGQELLFPLDLLQPFLRVPTVDRGASILGDPEEELEDLEEAFRDLQNAANELSYGKDRQGAYALYRLKPGEAIYTAVVVRFTDYSRPEDVLPACDIVIKRSNIKDVHAMKPGQPILIPVDMLSARFKPAGDPERREYEEVIREAGRLKGQVRSRDLEGVVVVLDPGHGGRDMGSPAAAAYGLYEDELNYDVMCRVKLLLETRTRAKVYVTMVDPSQGYTPSSLNRFVHDTDEELLTTPRYKNGEGGETDSTVSANLRWSLANSIFEAERARGTDIRKMVFTSFHCDAMFNEKMRGAMVYIPGASLRKPANLSGPTYAKYKEVKTGGRCNPTPAEAKRDEALSRNFAEVLLEELGNKRIRRHQEGDPIRSQIRRSPTNVFVPAVLKNNNIPTKVLVEMANLTNPTDRARLADPAWRQLFAEAYVDALKRFYAS